MGNTRVLSSARIFVVLPWLALLSNLAFGVPSSNIIEKKFEFPSPVQWKIDNVEISLIDVAWGPANSPEMTSRGIEDIHIKNPQFYPDRPYVLALHFKAKLPNVTSVVMIGQSGLVLVKNVDGDLQPPMGLSSTGFFASSGSPGIFDMRFKQSGDTEYWDFFPAPSDQKEFLFEVISPRNPTGPARFTFRIIRKDDDFVIINSAPNPEMSCLRFTKNFEGTIGTGSKIKLQLVRENTTLSGTEQYLRIGTTLWLQGTVDSLGNLVIEERYPKDQVTGIFKGKFSQDCRTVVGFFSKPDGFRLQPFDLREVGAANPRGANESDDQQ